MASRSRLRNRSFNIFCSPQPACSPFILPICGDVGALLDLRKLVPELHGASCAQIDQQNVRLFPQSEDLWATVCLRNLSCLALRFFPPRLGLWPLSRARSPRYSEWRKLFAIRFGCS